MPASQLQSSGFESQLQASCVEFIYRPPCLSRFSCFLPHSKNIFVSLQTTKLSIVNLMARLPCVSTFLKKRGQTRFLTSTSFVFVAKRPGALFRCWTRATHGRISHMVCSRSALTPCRDQANNMDLYALSWCFAFPPQHWHAFASSRYADT